jgi:hypothetical protein
MGADGACGLLFCAAKRSSAFPPNMPAGLRARVSRLGGFTRAVLRVIVSPSWGPALCHHGRSGYQPFSLVPNPDWHIVNVWLALERGVGRVRWRGRRK